MWVFDLWLLLHIFFHPGLYNKTHIQSVYGAIRMKLKPGSIVIIDLFHRRISLYCPSHQMTVHVQLEVEKQQIWITVYMCMVKKRKKNLYKFWILQRE